MYDAPSARDAAGKVVIHWFCQTKVQVCVDDLARIITLRDTGRVYIVAYLNVPTSNEAKKLDPIRESEGVGKGTVAFGKGVTTLVKQLGLTGGPASIVVDVDGKVAMVSTAVDASSLDSRDTKVNALVGAIKEYTAHHTGPDTAKVGEKFNLALRIQLAPWLTYSKQAMQFDLTVPKDIKCDATTLKREQLKIEEHTLTAQVSCSGPRGVYQAQGRIKFGYDSPNGAGFGDVDGVVWKFEIKQ
jgi:hypothetical protein